MKIMRFMLLTTLVMALAGCESAPIKGIKEGFSNLFQTGGNEGAQDLTNGIKQYEDGKYVPASRLLQSSLDKGLSGTSDQVRAHKYLAFIHCVSGREARCREEFASVLEIDPAFELAAAEIGHPIWGPVFRGVKGGR